MFMKRYKYALLFYVLFLSTVNLSAQNENYYIFDGTEFSVMFKCNADTGEVVDVQYSALDSNNNWQWHSFTIYDHMNLEDIDNSGFIFYCLDAEGNDYMVDYYRDIDIVYVTFINDDDSEGTEWTLTRRE